MSSDFQPLTPALRLLPRSRLTVGTILREPVDTVVRFVAWYLAQDADRIVLCFDDPQDPAIDILQGVDRVDCIRCTPDFWRSVGLDPTMRFTKRQNRAMQYVYSTIVDGWFLNVDSDELLHLDGRTLGDEVDTHGADVPAFRVEPVEHVQTPDSADLHFRCMMRPWMQRRLYGDLAAAMRARHGLMGHVHGKAVTRAGLDVRMRQHWAEDRNGAVVGDLVLGRNHGAYLLHFVDQGFDVWRAKLDWRLSSRGFKGPIRHMLLEALQSPDPEPALRALYDQFFVFDAERLELLSEVRSRFDLPVNPDDLVARHLRTNLVRAALRQTPEDEPSFDMPMDIAAAPDLAMRFG